jgi:hypothetical protein
MERLLSFDCANRSLAVCYASINKNIHSILLDSIKNSTDDKKSYLDYINIHFIKVYDLTKGNKLDTIQRAIVLKTQLSEIDNIISTYNHDIEYKKVLIEYQMSANDKSRNVSQQLVYHYCDKAQTHLVGPTLKNTIDLSKDGSLSYGSFIGKYASKYTANKNHSKENFKHYLKMTETEDILKNIKKKNYDDMADAFTQILGFTNIWVEK